MSDPLRDDRLTLTGLFFESYAGLRDVIGRRLGADSGLSPQSFEVLIRLARTPGHRLRMSELAAQTTLTPSGLTRAVDKLETQGLVERHSCPSDRRGSFAALTDEGLTTLESALPGHLAAVEDNITSLLTEREVGELEKILRKIRDHVKPGAVAGARSTSRSEQ